MVNIRWKDFFCEDSISFLVIFWIYIWMNLFNNYVSPRIANCLTYWNSWPFLKVESFCQFLDIRDFKVFCRKISYCSKMYENKARYTATLVAYGWAGTAKKNSVTDQQTDRPTNRWTDGAGCRVACTRLKIQTRPTPICRVQDKKNWTDLTPYCTVDVV